MLSCGLPSVNTAIKYLQNLAGSDTMGGSPHTNTPSRNNGRHVTDIGNHNDTVKHLKTTFRNAEKIFGLQ